MQAAADKNLFLIETELRFIRRHVQRVTGAGREDFETVDDIGMAVESALRALEEYKLSLQTAREETPEGVVLPEAA
jgi:hypothetical protein